MGLPAMRHDNRVSQRPALRLVRPASKPKRSSATRSNPTAAYAVFKAFAVVVVCVALLGIVRVWLTVAATEASMDAAKLKADIKTARYQGDMLEVRESALGSPSRVRAIAGKALGMEPAKGVTYLDIAADAAEMPDSKPEAKARVSAAAPVKRVAAASTAGPSGGILQRMVDLTVGEAQLLIVGDVGMASAR